jgi:copper resistance protein C
VNHYPSTRAIAALSAYRRSAADRPPRWFGTEIGILLVRVPLAPAASAIGRRVLVVGALAIALLCSALPAAAHAALVSSDPADGATLSSPPTVITLTFNEPVEGEFSQVAVVDEAGGHHESGTPHITGSEVHQEIGLLDAGSFKVSYRIVSADGLGH